MAQQLQKLLGNFKHVEVCIRCDFCLNLLDECDCEGYRPTKLSIPQVDISWIDSDGKECCIEVEKKREGWVMEFWFNGENDESE